MVDGLSGSILVNQVDQLKAARTTDVLLEEEVSPDSDSVDISDEAREKLKDEKEAIASGDEPEEGGSSSVIDKLIEEVKEKIAELQEKIAQLASKKDEASQQQMKMLQDELAAYSSRLMDLLEQKEKLESEAAGSA